VSSGQPESAFEDIKAEVLGQLDELASESNIVYRELVLPTRRLSSALATGKA
jgi:hypothetical protein